jgi:hypothetical protein
MGETTDQRHESIEINGFGNVQIEAGVHSGLDIGARCISGNGNSQHAAPILKGAQPPDQ